LILILCASCFNEVATMGKTHDSDPSLLFINASFSMCWLTNANSTLGYRPGTQSPEPTGWRWPSILRSLELLRQGHRLGERPPPLLHTRAHTHTHRGFFLQYSPMLKMKKEPLAGRALWSLSQTADCRESGVGFLRIQFWLTQIFPHFLPVGVVKDVLGSPGWATSDLTATFSTSEPSLDPTPSSLFSHLPCIPAPQEQFLANSLNLPSCPLSALTTLPPPSPCPPPQVLGFTST
jgi:hypothetical protein